jgi:catechol 2,3-dioxygenase-like lactoylglutathione lyase family enzyme
MSASAVVSLIVLRSGDIDSSCRFYRALGLDLVREQHETGPVHYSCTLGQLVIELYPKGKQTTSGLRLGLRLAHNPALLESIPSAGGIVISHDQERAVIRDPDGHTIEIEFS